MPCCISNTIRQEQDAGGSELPALGCVYGNLASSRCTRCGRNNKSCATVCRFRNESVYRIVADLMLQALFSMLGNQYDVLGHLFVAKPLLSAQATEAGEHLPSDRYRRAPAATRRPLGSMHPIHEGFRRWEPQSLAPGPAMTSLVAI